MICKNCGQPIVKAHSYWRHVRDVKARRIWCFPNADKDSPEYVSQAQPKLLWCDECHCNHEKPQDCPYDARMIEASAADIEFERRQERLAEYNDL